MEKLITFKCDTCNKIFNSEDEALKCEIDHVLCYCKKSNILFIYYNEHGYGKSTHALINFEKGYIKLYFDDDDIKYNEKVVNIKFCPFCGEKL